MGKASNEQYTPTTATAHIRTAIIDDYRLFKNDFTPDANSVLADFTEADFSGYAKVFPNEAFYKNDTDNRFEQQHAVGVFTHNGGGVSNTIYGWYAVGAVDNGGGTQSEVMMSERFASPITMQESGDSIRIHPHQHYVGVDD